MDGAQAQHRYSRGTRLSVLVSRRTFCLEGSLKRGLERIVMRILVIVGCDFPENGKRRKSKVSSAISLS